MRSCYIVIGKVFKIDALLFGMETKTISPEQFIEKISKIEVMLEELKTAIYSFDRELLNSIQRGEKDIEEGRVTICRNEEELEKFFDSI